MSATSPLFAGIAEQFGGTVINILAVGGAAAAGYVLTFVIVWTIYRLAIHKSPPKQGLKILSSLCGIGAGVLAALLLFGGVGGGFGLGPGGWFGPGSNASQTDTGKNTPTHQTPPKTTPTNVDASQVAPPLRVKVLGIKDKEEKFYIVDGETERRNLKSVEQVIRDRMEKKPSVRELIILLKDENTSAGYDSPAVKALHAAGDRFHLSVGYEPPREMPK